MGENAEPVEHLAHDALPGRDLLAFPCDDAVGEAVANPVGDQLAGERRGAVRGRRDGVLELRHELERRVDDAEADAGCDRFR